METWTLFANKLTIKQVNNIPKLSYHIATQSALFMLHTWYGKSLRSRTFLLFSPAPCHSTWRLTGANCRLQEGKWKERGGNSWRKDIDETAEYGGLQKFRDGMFGSSGTNIRFGQSPSCLTVSLSLKWHWLDLGKQFWSVLWVGRLRSAILLGKG